MLSCSMVLDTAVLPLLPLTRVGSTATAAAAVSRAAAASMAGPRCCSSCESCSCRRTDAAARDPGEACMAAFAWLSQAARARPERSACASGCCRAWMNKAASLPVTCAEQQSRCRDSRPSHKQHTWQVCFSGSCLLSSAGLVKEALTVSATCSAVSCLQAETCACNKAVTCTSCTSLFHAACGRGGCF